MKSVTKKWSLFATGLAFGLLVGIATDKLVLWLPIGIAVGLGCGISAEKKEDEK